MFAEYKYLSSLSEVNINKLIEMVKSDKSLSLHNRDFLLTSLRGSFNTAEKYLQAQYEKNRYDYESISQTFKDLHQRPKLLSSFNKTSLLIATGSLISACILLEEYNFVKNCPLIQLEKKKLSKDKDSKQ